MTPSRGQLTLPPAYPRQRGHGTADPATPIRLHVDVLEGAHAAAMPATKFAAARVRRMRTAWTRFRNNPRWIWCCYCCGPCAQWSPTADPLARRAQRPRRNPHLLNIDRGEGGPPLGILLQTMGIRSQASAISLAVYCPISSTQRRGKLMARTRRTIAHSSVTHSPPTADFDHKGSIMELGGSMSATASQSQTGVCRNCSHSTLNLRSWRTCKAPCGKSFARMLDQCSRGAIS